MCNIWINDGDNLIRIALNFTPLALYGFADFFASHCLSCELLVLHLNVCCVVNVLFRGNHVAVYLKVIMFLTIIPECIPHIFHRFTCWLNDVNWLVVSTIFYFP